MKRPLAALCAFLIMGGMLWTGLQRRGAPAAGSPSRLREINPTGRRPVVDLSGASDRIEALLEEAQRGDVAAYLASFDGPLRARLEQQAGQRGRADFAAELSRAARARKGHAVFAPMPDGEGSDAARITVESTFADRIERQTYRLVRSDAGWLISDVERARDRVPKNPLGAPATFQEPEGVPVSTEAMKGIPTTDTNLEEH